MSYRGTNYCGYQKQLNRPTIQQTVEDTISKVIGEKVWIHGVSRTDSGVHANEYCFSFEMSRNIPCEKLTKIINNVLPLDISILTCEDVPLNFHARHDCISKEYIYKIYIGNRNPFFSDFAVNYTYPFDFELCNEACKFFQGTYDFYGLSNNYKADIKKLDNTVRTICEFFVTEQENLKIFVVKGDGFLYNMVRVLVGTVLAVNEGRIKLGDLAEIIASANRNLAGKTMPPYGLYLNKCFYEEF